MFVEPPSFKFAGPVGVVCFSPPPRHRAPRGRKAATSRTRCKGFAPAKDYLRANIAPVRAPIATRAICPLTVISPAPPS